MKKLIIIIMFLIPIFKSSLKETTFLFNSKTPNIIVHLKDKDLYLDLNDYIIGVVASEMPALFEEEALKAQSIASRSYAASKLKDNQIEISSTTNDQVYSENFLLQDKWKEEYRKYYDKIANTVKSTKNKVIKRNGKILKTYYFSMSNGYTQSSQTVFKEDTFTSVVSPEDTTNKNYKVSKNYTSEELQRLINVNNLEDINIKRTQTNHIDTITIDDKTYTGIEFRKLLNLRSTDFEIIQNENNVTITTIGYGHGVGMSEYGANKMAKEGATYEKILNHYYQNTKIENI